MIEAYNTKSCVGSYRFSTDTVTYTPWEINTLGEGGTCACADGWFGSSCNMTCPGINATNGFGDECGGYGTCGDDGTCTCDSCSELQADGTCAEKGCPACDHGEWCDEYTRSNTRSIHVVYTEYILASSTRPQTLYTPAQL